MREHDTTTTATTTTTEDQARNTFFFLGGGGFRYHPRNHSPASATAAAATAATAASVGVVKNAAWLIGIACNAHPANQERAGNGGFVELALELAQRHNYPIAANGDTSKDPETAEKCLRGLAECMPLAANKLRFRAASGTDVMVAVLRSAPPAAAAAATAAQQQQQQQHATVVEWACRVCGSANVDDVVEVQFGERGGLMALVGVMQRYRTNATVVEHACSAMRVSVYNAANKDRARDAGALEATVDCLRTHATAQENVAARGCWIVGLL